MTKASDMIIHEGDPRITAEMDDARMEVALALLRGVFTQWEREEAEAIDVLDALEKFLAQVPA